MNESRLWTVGAVLIIAALVVGTWFLAVAPRLSDARDADTSREQAATLNDLHRQTLAVLQADHERMDEIVAELEIAHSVIPENPDQSSFVRAIGEQARAAGVVVDGLTFGPATAFVPPDDGDVDAIATSRELAASGLYVIPITINVDGGYNAMMNFIAAVQDGQRLILVHDAQLLLDDEVSTLTLRGELFGISPLAAQQPDAPVSTE